MMRSFPDVYKRQVLHDVELGHGADGAISVEQGGVLIGEAADGPQIGEFALIIAEKVSGQIAVAAGIRNGQLPSAVIGIQIHNLSLIHI